MFYLSKQIMCGSVISINGKVDCSYQQIPLIELIPYNRLMLDIS